MSMSMADLSEETQRIIAREELGPPQQIYGPPTISTIIMGLIILACAGFIALISFFSFSGSAAPRQLLTLMSLFFFLAVLFLVAMGLWRIYKAFADRNIRIVLCVHGVAYVQPPRSETFHWQDVLTTTRKVIPAGRGQHQIIYTVHCRNERKHVFQNIANLQDLAERIDVQVALAKHT